MISLDLAMKFVSESAIKAQTYSTVVDSSTQQSLTASTNKSSNAVSIHTQYHKNKDNHYYFQLSKYFFTFRSNSEVTSTWNCTVNVTLNLVGIE